MFSGDLLTGGTMNLLRRITINDVQAVLRIQTSPLVNRRVKKQEFAITALASDMGISPQMISSNAEQGYMVLQYIQPDGQSIDIEEACRLIDQVHQMPVNSTIDRELSIRDMFVGYLELSLSRDQELLNQFDCAYARLKGMPKSICHLDPIKANFVCDSDRAYLIDFEYSTLEFSIIDQAMLAYTFENEPFVENFFNVENQTAWQAAKFLCAVVEYGWYLSAEGFKAETEQARQRYYTALQRFDTN